MIIELAGLPGSGKSTIVRELQRGDPSFHSLVVRPAFGALLPNRAGGVNAWAALQPGPAWPAWASLCARHAAQSSLDPGARDTLLLEEGIVHHVWRSRFLHPGLDRRPWGALLESPAPLIVLVASQAVRHQRVSGKAHGGPVNRQLATAAPGDATWQRAERLMEEVLAAARGFRTVVTVNTEGELGNALGRVRGAVVGWVTGGG